MTWLFKKRTHHLTQSYPAITRPEWRAYPSFETPQNQRLRLDFRQVSIATNINSYIFLNCSTKWCTRRGGKAVARGLFRLR